MHGILSHSLRRAHGTAVGFITPRKERWNPIRRIPPEFPFLSLTRRLDLIGFVVVESAPKTGNLVAISSLPRVQTN